MKQISSSEFRRKYATLNEPTEVLSFDEPIGEWFPRGTRAREFTAEQVSVAEPESEPRMTIRPTHNNQRRLVGKTRRILDPVAMRDQARTRQNEMTPRQFVRKEAD